MRASQKLRVSLMRASQTPSLAPPAAPLVQARLAGSTQILIMRTSQSPTYARLAETQSLTYARVADSFARSACGSASASSARRLNSDSNYAHLAESYLCAPRRNSESHLCARRRLLRSLRLRLR